MLELVSISKRFNGHPALSGISLSVAPGEIHGLLGLNGSGKSTLLNILSGAPVIRETGGFDGEIRINGRPAAFESPAQALAAGVGRVHQETTLFDNLSIAENIRLGREEIRFFNTGRFFRDLALPHRERNAAAVRALLTRMGLGLDPDTRVGRLPPARKQFIDAARELDRSGLKVLLLDEPSSSLNGSDTKMLISLVRNLAAQGIAVVYVTHSLAEAMAVSDRITVLRAGQVTASFARDAFCRDRITHAMAGRGVDRTCRARQSVTGHGLLSLKDFSARVPGDGVTGVNLTVFQGEILGVAGLCGHGKSAVGPAIMGLSPWRGEALLRSRPVPPLRPDLLAAQGVALISDDRRVGLLHDHSVMENLVFSALQQTRRFHKKGPAGWLGVADRKRAEAYAQACVARYRIACRSLLQNAGELSGGNQQKLCLARALATSPALLFAGEPTRGIDLEAREAVMALLLEANETHGTTIVLSSEDTADLRRICHRILVFYQGRISAILPPDCHEQDLAQAFSGGAV